MTALQFVRDGRACQIGLAGPAERLGVEIAAVPFAGPVPRCDYVVVRPTRPLSPVAQELLEAILDAWRQRS